MKNLENHVALTAERTESAVPQRQPAFTPGPWSVSGIVEARYLNGIGDVTLVRRTDARDNRYVAMCSLDAMGHDSGSARTTPSEREANAHLIAAAPDMYAALTECQQILAILVDPANKGGGITNMAAWENCVLAEVHARAALRKARGEK